MISQIKKIWNGYVGILSWASAGIGKCWRTNHTEDGIIMPWILEQNKFVSTIFAIPAFFFEHIINMLKLVFYIYVIFICAILPVLPPAVIFWTVKGIRILINS